MEPPHRRRRRFPFVLAVLVAGGLAWVWLQPERSMQARVLGTQAVVLLAAVAIALWALCFAGFGRRTRLGLLALLVVAGAGGAALLRVRGVTGDFLPILEWRFAKRALEDAPASQERAPEAPAHLDWPGCQGPDRDATLEGFELARDWSAHPPRVLWRRPVGEAWSGCAVVGGRVVTLEQRGEEETVACYALADGLALWSTGWSARYDSVVGGVGPRSTPAVDGGQVFVHGATGTLACLELESGALLWSRDVIADAGGLVPEWGAAASPLVLEGHVVVPDGTGLAAYDRESGEPLWRGGDDAGGYSSPLACELAGTAQVVLLGSRSVAAYDPRSGERLWSTPWPHTNPHVAQPVPIGADRLLVSSGYGVGATLFEIAEEGGGLAPRALWRSRHLKSKFAPILVLGGFAYGLDDGTLACIELAGGGRRWKEGREGHGQLVRAGALLLLVSEGGELVLIEPSPQERRELGRLRVFGGKTWNPPALAAPFLVLRTDRELACVELPGA